MIYSKYFPTIDECLLHRSNGENNVEIPADVYDDALYGGIITEGQFIRGNYDYGTAKIFSQSPLIDALKFDETSGEIKTTSMFGISAEITFVLATWNGYDRKSAIEQAILATMKNNSEFLPKLMAEKVSQIKTANEYHYIEDITKYVAGKSSGYVEGKIKAGKAVSSEISINVPKAPQILQKIGDKLDDVVSVAGDALIYVFKYGESVLDCVKGRISKKQLIKNSIVTAVSGAGSGLGYNLVGGTAATVFGAPAILAVGAALAGGYLFKVLYKKMAKKRLDMFFSDDSEKMRKIFLDELLQMLDGKFLTQYELEILLEAIQDTVTDEKLKEMYHGGDFSSQKAWAQDFIKKCLEQVEGSRMVIIQPSPTEWKAGLQCVNDILNSGENINELMQRRREESLQRRCEILSRYNLKAYEIAQALSIINPMFNAQVETVRTLSKMQADEANYQSEKQQIQQKRAALKERLRGR